MEGRQGSFGSLPVKSPYATGKSEQLRSVRRSTMASVAPIWSNVHPPISHMGARAISCRYSHSRATACTSQPCVVGQSIFGHHA